MSPIYQKLSSIRNWWEVWLAICACLLKLLSDSRKRWRIARDAEFLLSLRMAAIVPIVLENVEGQYSVLKKLKVETAERIGFPCV